MRDLEVEVTIMSITPDGDGARVKFVRRDRIPRSRRQRRHEGVAGDREAGRAHAGRAATGAAALKSPCTGFRAVLTDALHESCADEIAPRVSNWGRWGADDERGTVNFITPEVIRRAAACVEARRGVQPRPSRSTSDGPQFGQGGRVNPRALHDLAAATR